MATYAPHYRHDIFVSYAHVDNEPLAGVDTRWVTNLITGLKPLLGRKLGRADAYSLWMDYELRGHEAITPYILEQLQDTAILLLILSTGYLASEWCRRELSTFVARAGKATGRLFVVEREPLERPEELQDILGYRFWVRNEAKAPRTLGVPKPSYDEFEFYLRLDELARHIVDKLRRLRAQGDNPTVIPPKPAPSTPNSAHRATVFLSEHKMAKIMFRSLSERGNDRRDTRRPVPLSEVATLAKVPWQEVAAVVEVFRQEGRSFLTPPVGKDLEPDSVLDISHESLIRQWQRLQDWTTQEAEAAALYQRLEDSACRWEKRQVALWRTPELENALAWRDSVTPTPEWAKRYVQHFDLAMRFLDASAAQQQQEEQQAEAARQRELRQARRQVTLLVLGLMVAIGLALWAIYEQRQAERSEEQARSALMRTVNVMEGVLSELNSKKLKNVPEVQAVRHELAEIALENYREFIQQRGDDPSVRTWVWYNLGVAFHAQGKLEDAIAAYQHQVEVRPAHEWAWTNLGVALYTQGKIDEARAAFQKQAQVRPDPADAWNKIGVALWEEGWNDEAAAAFARGLAVQPRHLSLLSNDAELALAQGDITRLQTRVAAALPRVTPKDQKFVILRFVAWLANPAQGWADVMTAISKLDPEVKVTWDFSDTRRAIARLDVSTQQTAQHFIDFFEGHIDLPTLQARLAAQ